MASTRNSHHALQICSKLAFANVKKAGPDLTQRQLALLLAVYLDPGPHYVRSLAQKLGVGKPVITRALDSLTALSLVRRMPDPTDRRSVLVTRTVKGSVYLSELGELLSNELAAVENVTQAA